MSHDLLGRVEETANRLRAIQTDLADAEETVRREHLEEEVERALSSVMPADRREFLAQLAARFPSWDSDVTGAPAAPLATGPVRSAADEREMKDPSFVLKRLIELTRGLPEEKKVAVRQALEEAGLAAGGVGSWPDAPAQRLKGVLTGMQGQPEAGRVLDLLTVLLEFVLSIEKVVWRTWQQMAPRSQIKRRGQLQRAAGHFVSGDQEVSRNEIQQELEELRQLTAATIAAVSQAGHLAYVRLGNLSPEAVMGAAKDEGKAAWQSWEAAYWKKYQQLAESLDPTTFEVEVMHAMADYVEQILKRGRS